VQSDGKILVGGGFTTIGNTTRARIARLNSDGSLDSTFIREADNLVRDFAVQADGKILVVGSFTTVAGVPRPGLARLNADGSPDVAFNVSIAGTNTSAALFHPKCSRYARRPNSPRRQLRDSGWPIPQRRGPPLNSDGSLDGAFNPNAHQRCV